jgi:hypothetical protein
MRSQGEKLTQGETAAYCLILKRRLYRPVFPGEESSCVAVIQSLSVSHHRSKSSAKFTEAHNHYQFYIDYGISVAMSMRLFLGL